jgi:Undecaprenyl-phosphate glucose phosphotransferase
MSDLKAVPRLDRSTLPPMRKRFGGWLSSQPGRDPHLIPIAFSLGAAVFELLLISIVGALIVGYYIGDRPQLLLDYVLPVPLHALSAVALFHTLDLYAPQALRRFPKGIAGLLLAWVGVFLFAFALIFFLKLEGRFSRVVFGVWFLTGLLILPAYRLLLSRFAQTLAAKGVFRQRAVLVGGGAEAEAFVKALGNAQEHDLVLLGMFDDRTDERSPEQVGELKKLGTVDDLLPFVRQEAVDIAFFTLPVSAETRILDMLRKLCVLPIDIRLAAHSQKLKFRPQHYLFFGGLPAFSIMDRPVAGWANLQKMLFDRLLGALILIGVSPIMALVALAVKIDSKGPIFFRQKRFGFNNEPIEVFKFRSMYVEMSDSNAAKLATRDDPRITKVGRFIRRTSLDELPQLLNVVFYGNLSLVGPRPHAFQAKAADRLYQDVVDGYFARHRVKPGITGWAQINGWRGETDTSEKIQKRIEHDLHYIENWSLMFDLGIVILTPLALIKGENAY